VKVKVGAVSYLNTKPLIYGLQNGMMGDEIELLMDYPAKIAAALLDGKIDLGLIPLAVLPKMPDFHIISDFCIGATGNVASVCLFSDVPINQIKAILLDYQSRTSVALLKILLKEFWKIEPELINTTENYRHLITGTTAGLVIGDRALEQRSVSKYIYDLAGTWIEYTKLPFVFAAWVSNKKLTQHFITQFNEANKFGFDHLQEIIHQNPFPQYSLEKYYTENISFNLDSQKKAGLQLFLSKLPVEPVV
jgi:chorismate dehydratase